MHHVLRQSRRYGSQRWRRDFPLLQRLRGACGNQRHERADPPGHPDLRRLRPGGAPGRDPRARRLERLRVLDGHDTLPQQQRQLREPVGAGQPRQPDLGRAAGGRQPAGAGAQRAQRRHGHPARRRRNDHLLQRDQQQRQHLHQAPGLDRRRAVGRRRDRDHPAQLRHVAGGDPRRQPLPHVVRALGGRLLGGVPGLLPPHLRRRNRLGSGGSGDHGPSRPRALALRRAAERRPVHDAADFLPQRLVLRQHHHVLRREHRRAGLDRQPRPVPDPRVVRLGQRQHVPRVVQHRRRFPARLVLGHVQRRPVAGRLHRRPPGRVHHGTGRHLVPARGQRGRHDGPSAHGHPRAAGGRRFDLPAGLRRARRRRRVRQRLVLGGTEPYHQFHGAAPFVGSRQRDLPDPLHRHRHLDRNLPVQLLLPHRRLSLHGDRAAAHTRLAAPVHRRRPGILRTSRRRHTGRNAAGAGRGPDQPLLRGGLPGRHGLLRRRLRPQLCDARAHGPGRGGRGA